VLLTASGPGAPAPVAGVSREAAVLPANGRPVTPPAIPAPLPQPTGTTSLVSVRRGGGFPDGPSAGTAISSSGRYVAFASSATNLVADGLGGLSVAVFLANRKTGNIVRLPLPRGVPADGSAVAPSISADGSVVAFAYTGAAVGNFPESIVMAWDRASGTTSVVSLYSDGFASPSREPSVSGDGRYVAYTSDNSGIVTNDNNRTSDVFRYDRQSGGTVLVSVGFGGNAAGNSGQPSISGDGSMVAFTSSANDVLLPQNNGASFQVFVRDMNAGVTRLESMASDGTPADAASRLPSISDDGQYLAFDSSATNLVPGLGKAPSQAWRRNLQTGALDLVSMTPAGGPWPTASGRPAISRDGRMVAYLTVGSGSFDSVANLTAIGRYPTDVFLRDMVAQQTALISVDLNGKAADVFSYGPSVGGSGRYVAFASSSGALVSGDDNKVLDVFVRDLPPSPRLNPPTIDFGTRALGSPPTPGAAILNNTGWGPLPVAPATVGGATPADFPIQGDGCQGRVLYRRGWRGGAHGGPQGPRLAGAGHPRSGDRPAGHRDRRPGQRLPAQRPGAAHLEPGHHAGHAGRHDRRQGSVHRRRPRLPPRHHRAAGPRGPVRRRHAVPAAVVEHGRHPAVGEPTGLRGPRPPHRCPSRAAAAGLIRHDRQRHDAVQALRVRERAR